MQRTIAVFAILSLFAFQDAYALWVKTNGPGSGNPWDFAVSGNDIFVAMGDGGVFVTSNNGTNWTAANNGLPIGTDVSSLAVSGSNLYAGTTNSGIFKSINGGSLWSAFNAGFSISGIHAFLVSDTFLFAGTTTRGIFRCANNSLPWTSVNNGLTDTFVISLAAHKGCIFAGTNGGTTGHGIFRSLNNGASWDSVNSGLTVSRIVPAFAVMGDKLFAGCGGNVFVSTDSGSSWTDLHYCGAGIMSLAVSDSNLFVGTYGNGVLLSSDSGSSWKEVNEGLTSLYVMPLTVSGGFLFAGIISMPITSDTVWRRPISEMTAVKPSNTSDPRQFQKCRISYSGHSRSEVIISYTLQTPCYVELGIYSSNGKRIAFLEQVTRNSGEHKARFDFGRYSPGAYMYRFIAGSYEESGSLMVTKKR